MPAPSRIPDPDYSLSLETALLRIFGTARTDRIYALATLLDDDPADIVCDAVKLHLDELSGFADPGEIAAAVSRHRLLARPCEPITTELPCDCEAPHGA